jgi:hypothetical protein
MPSRRPCSSSAAWCKRARPSSRPRRASTASSLPSSSARCVTGATDGMAWLCARVSSVPLCPVCGTDVGRADHADGGRGGVERRRLPHRHRHRRGVVAGGLRALRRPRAPRLHLGLPPYRVLVFALRPVPTQGQSACRTSISCPSVFYPSPATPLLPTLTWGSFFRRRSSSKC